jgi:hypothetical protein
MGRTFLQKSFHPSLRFVQQAPAKKTLTGLYLMIDERIAMLYS